MLISSVGQLWDILPNSHVITERSDAVHPPLLGQCDSKKLCWLNVLAACDQTQEYLATTVLINNKYSSFVSIVEKWIWLYVNRFAEVGYTKLYYLYRCVVTRCKRAYFYCEAGNLTMSLYGNWLALEAGLILSNCNAEGCCFVAHLLNPDCYLLRWKFRVV